MKRLIGVTLALLMVVGCGKDRKQSASQPAPAEIKLEAGIFALDANSVNVMFKESVTEDKIEEARAAVENFRRLNSGVEFSNESYDSAKAQLGALGESNDAPVVAQRTALNTQIQSIEALRAELETARTKMAEHLDYI